MFYFAYGSNMDSTQMSARCRFSVFFNIARLPNYRLCFPRKSIKRNCGVASVEPHQGSEVWGVVYRITETDLRDLDKNEGYQLNRKDNAYFRNEWEVFIGGDPNQPLIVWIYIANFQPSPPRPSEDYMAVIIGGAKQRGLPADYIEKLEAIQTG